MTLWVIHSGTFQSIKSFRYLGGRCVAQKDGAGLMPDSDAAEDRLETEKHRAHPQKTHLSKYTNLDPCCYGNPLMEFHHQHCRHAHLSPDWPRAALPLQWLVTCSLSAILLSSSRLMSSSLRWGPFSCCLTISRSFLCCLEREVTGKREMSRGVMHAQRN